MQKLVILCAFLAVTVADVSHLFRQPPSTRIQAPYPNKVPSHAQPQHHSHTGPEIAIIRHSQNVEEDGNYHYDFETANGIAVQEQASVQHTGPEQASKSVHGTYHYTSPEGSPVVVSYVADENGFRAEGAHLPVAPPVPEAIVKALAYIAAHPQQEERVSGHHRRH